jgi:hypothetical protein
LKIHFKRPFYNNRIATVSLVASNNTGGVSSSAGTVVFLQKLWKWEKRKYKLLQAFENQKWNSLSKTYSQQMPKTKGKKN